MEFTNMEYAICSESENCQNIDILIASLSISMTYYKKESKILL